MVFSSPLFLFLFFPVTLGIYYLIKCASPTTNRFVNLWLLFGSILFYVWGAPKSAYLLFFFLGIIIDFYIAILIGRYRQVEISTATAKRLLFLAIGANILFLGFYKYANFFVSELDKAVGGPVFHWQSVVLPIGISFIVFHKISYLVDVYRRKVQPRQSLPEFTLYLLFFPQLIAGPIVRYYTIAGQLAGRSHSVEYVFEGMWRFSVGLGKKVLIANQLGLIADTIFAQPVESLDPTLAWIGILMYSMQIYFDFSGYSDMAIGLGMMFGFRLPENFNRPYVSRSITEFWRRWHMSLSLFFRDYVYIPLGGSHQSLQRTLVSLWIVFLLCGLWHGAKWTFVFWGAYYGIWLTLERLFLGRLLEKAMPIAANLYAFLVVLIGWVFFRSPDLSYAFSYFGKMFDLHSILNPNPRTYDLVVDYGLQYKVVICSIVALLMSFVPESVFRRPTVPMDYLPLVKGASTICLLAYSVINLATGTFNPFLYFQF